MQFKMNDEGIKWLLNAHLLLLLLHRLLPRLLLAHPLFKILLISPLLQGPVDALKSATIEPLTLLSIGACPGPYNLPVCSLCGHELRRDC